jgi:hypothetical protein
MHLIYVHRIEENLQKRMLCKLPMSSSSNSTSPPKRIGWRVRSWIQPTGCIYIESIKRGKKIECSANIETCNETLVKKEKNK